MQSIQQTFQITYTYGVYFTEHLFGLSNPELKTFFKAIPSEGFERKALVVIDQGVANCHPNLTNEIQAYFQQQVSGVTLSGPALMVPGGEASKNNPAHFNTIIEAIDQQGIDRHSFVIAIGGGAVLDLVGYAAAVAHRGIKLIRIPTTVLAQNDSGVGVKNSINFQGKKNFLGTFAPPIAVFNDYHFLGTLEDRDWRGGVAEAIKVALIKDSVFFEWIEQNVAKLVARDQETMSYLIFRCAQMHTDHIAGGDPFEFGSSRPLDFGHWAAHKLEYLTNFEVRHGEAVAMGIALDCVYAHLAGMLPANDLNRILQVLQGLGFTLYHDRLSENNKINLKNGIQEFREHLGGRLTIMLLEKIGQGVEVHHLDEALISLAVDHLEGLHLKSLSYP
ncbi:3-dehydroquinate synthase [Dyadobacter tibetensis]|uniref:3-dehydroquinate synthase n=1 Tax=Dyadobacter tibetensis TaxID=1211851 RepID=UPI0004702E2D|nr:3-dehydroquinate synthase [Dyadobacter tibetensis]